MKVSIFHNILWSKYKGGVFSALSVLKRDLSFDFIQIAETEGDRVGLSNVDVSYHNYPYKLLFSGSYGDVSLFRLVFFLVREVFKSKSDLVVIPGYHRPEYWAMLFACMVAGKKRAVFCDSTIFDRQSSIFKVMAKRIFFGLCNGYFGYGLRSREYLLSLGARSDRIFHRCQAAALPHDYSVALARSERLAKAPKLPDVRFLYAGRLSEEKGLDTLLKAFTRVLADMPKAKLVLVGSGPLRDQLESLARDLGIAQCVEFAGSMAIEALVHEYAMATCFVLPSRSEPWGLVVNEALSYGCPVVVSNVCGCVPELVQDGVTGYKFQVDNISELAQRMNQVAIEFTDTAAVTDRCMSLISNYSPERAAQQILDGCKIILQGRFSA